MQGLPAFASQPTNPASGGRNRQRNQKQKSQKTNGDETPLHDVGKYLVKVEVFIEPDVGRKVQANVEKRKESQHAPIANQPKLVGKLSDWGDE